MPRRATGRRRTTVFISPAHLKALKILAARRNTTSADLIRTAVREFIWDTIEHARPATSE